jgi:hypothetical protein
MPITIFEFVDYLGKILQYVELNRNV